MPAPFNLSDVAFAGRLMRKQPVMTATAILALATGIFLATTGFTFLEAVIWARLPFSGGDRFVLIDVYEEPGGRRGSIGDARFRMLRANVPAFQHLGAFTSAQQNLLLPSGDVVLTPTLAITPDSFAVLPYAPVAGRALTSADASPAAPPVAVLRESLWRRHFSADPGIIGGAVNFAGVQRIVVGIMPDALEFPNSPEAWFPLQTADAARVFGVLAPPQALALAQAQLTAVSQQFEGTRPEAPKLRLQALPFAEALSRGLDLLTGALVFVLVLVLLVISANIANLVFARTLSRSSELAVRTALGASRAPRCAGVL